MYALGSRASLGFWVVWGLRFCGCWACGVGISFPFFLQGHPGDFIAFGGGLLRTFDQLPEASV